MVNVSQGTMRNLARSSCSGTWSRLPIRYFDTHAHGDIMSVYTNDVDTLRQLMSQSIPQVINSSVTILTSFVSMLVLDVPLTLHHTGDDRCHALGHLQDCGKILHAILREQQKDLGIVNGYIEEMMDGQKVVKVFCHEEKEPGTVPRSQSGSCAESADKANTFSNITHARQREPWKLSAMCCAR